MEFWEELKQLGKDALDKTVETADVAQLSVSVKEQEHKLEKAYAKLGRLYYERHAADPEAELKAACAEAEQLQKAIADLQIKIKQTKGLKVCAGCGAEITEGGRFCMRCGRKYGD